MELAAGRTVSEVCAKLEVTETTYYRWRSQYGGMKVEEVKRQREVENARLKRLLADLALDNAMLKEVAKGNF